MNKILKIAIWWNIPCKSIVPVARELATIKNVDVTFIAESELSESRKKLGWELSEFGKSKYFVLSKKEWKKEVKDFLSSDFDIHIFNGIYFFPKIRYAVDLSIKKDINFGIISEAYHNPYKGFKRILKTFFTRIVTPFRVFIRAKKAKFVLSASGSNIKPFLHLGWKRKQFFPFGYFPENNGIKLSKKTKNVIPTLLCTGYITKNKGQHLLIKALSEVKKSGIKFKCYISGYGGQMEYIKKLANKLNLDDQIEFVGVLSEKKLNYYKSIADLFIAPGYEEPWGIRINEALLAHTPVVVSDGIGASELVSISGAGKVFKRGDLDSLVSALKELLQNENIQKSKKKAKEYSKFITPQVAAKYLLGVINYSLGKNETKPNALWLMSN